MRTLLVLRHAKSSWKDPGLDDHDRPLNGRGRKTAPRMGTLLRERDLVPEHILSSTALRARRTAELAAEAAGFTGTLELAPDLYLAGPERAVRLLHDVPDRFRRVMLVGHNPGLQELVELLTGCAERFPTAALARIELPAGAWAEVPAGRCGVLEGLWRPREL